MTRIPTAGGRPLVWQYGPAIGTDGGMATVLDVYSRMPLRRYRFEIVPTWSPGAALWGLGPFVRALAGVVGRGRRGNRGSVVQVHLSERGSFVREGLVAAAARALGARVVMSLHGRDLAAFATARPRLVRRVFALADAVVALGPTTAGVAAGYLRPGTVLAVVPNPIEVPETVAPAGDRPEVVLFGGEVGRVKGVDVLLDAWELVRQQRPAAGLVIAGPRGDLDPVTRAGVTWAGPLPRPELLATIESSRVAVLPSRAEVMPMFLLEAMARARPVVSTPVADIPALLDGSGRLVPVGDATALAEQITDLLADPAAATREGAALRDRTLRHYSPAAVAEQLEAVYDDVLGRAR
ncbi:MAG TPA: glycosyltransferase family 4 protein [Acidimicrobiia bacterium]|nr:glycosyltransferase family 4 protein [Acidimicrobiia bacterium]